MDKKNEIKKELYGDDITNWQIIAGTFKYALVYKWRWLGLMLLSLTILGLGLFSPLVFKYLVDNVLIAKKFELFGLVFMVYVLVRIISLFLGYISALKRVDFSFRISQSFQNDIFEHLQYKIFSFYGKRKIGDLTRVLIKDVSITQQLIGTGEQILMNFINLLLTLGIILFFDWRIAILGLITIPIYALVQIIYIKKLKEEVVESTNADVSLYNFIESTLSNMVLIKLFAKEPEEVEEGKKVIAEEKKTKQQVFGTAISIASIIGLITAVAMIGTVWFGARAVMHGTLTLGAFFAIFTYVSRLFGPISSLVSVPTSLQTALVSGRRIFGLIAEEEERGMAIKSFKKINGKIEFRNVYFRYPGESKNTFNGLTFEIKPGEKVVFVGENGTGKSTIWKLILRFYEPNSGEILIDGEPINQIKRDSIRKNIGVLPQETLLMPGTIRDNIVYSDTKASAEKLYEATEIVDLHNKIMSLEHGYATEIDNKNKVLSAGEIQRLSLARTLIKNPDVFIFDEPTSKIDPKHRNTIVDKLNEISKNKTTITIAHDYFHLKNADKIFIIKNGQIAEQGGFDELIKKGGKFADLYASFIKK